MFGYKRGFWRAVGRAAILWAGLGLCLCTASAADASGVPGIVVGRAKLTPCFPEYAGYCGTLVRPIDPSGRVYGTIKIGFALFRHTDQAKKQLGTIIAQEGGPGFSTTGSRDGYVRLLTPLRDRRDILLIDKRGTGTSGAIDCPALQKGGGLGALRDCGRQLGDTAWVYSSKFAADDVAAVLETLGTGPVDYYGDSYATFFGQVFATRYPKLLKTLVLDSAYPTVGEDAYFQTEIRNGPTAFALVCARSQICHQIPGSEKERFKTLLNALRSSPVSGRAPGAYGEMLKVTADAGALFTIVANAGNSYTAYRDIDAAGRAWLGSSDALPLLRLVAEAVDGEAVGGSYRQYSTGLQFAVQCADYKQLFDMRDSQNARHGQYEASIATTQSNHPNIYAPFTLAEGLSAVENPEVLNQCEAWPRAPGWATPGVPVPHKTAFPKVPTLVLSGELDTVTSPDEGRETAALFPNATFVLVPNAVHETAIGNAGYNVPSYGGDLAQCVGPMVVRFIRSGGATPNEFCLSGIRPVRPVPAFATAWNDVFAAHAEAGNSADAMRLRFASAVAETVGDALSRYSIDVDNEGPGLRGGKLKIVSAANGYTIKLINLQWTADLIVSGEIDWDQLTGKIVANVNATATGHSGTLKISWNDKQSDAQAIITGNIDRETVAASRIAP